MENDFKIEFLDHVALRVRDIEKSIIWYEQVFGFRKYKFKEWGDFPVFMLQGKTGVALFPANSNDPEVDINSKNAKIDHFAFNVSRENFEKAKKKLKNLEINFALQDHHFFESLYLRDPDNHIVELTTIIVPEHKFYK